MAALLRHRRGRVFVAAVILVAVMAAAGWHLYSRVFDDTVVVGHATGAALLWSPGINSGGVPVPSSANGPAARRLGRLVNETPKLPSGRINCPSETGSRVTITFHGTGHQEQVTITLTGCAGPPGRMMTDALRNGLENLAPPGFWPQRLQ